jgi:hypothetical protein
LSPAHRSSPSLPRCSSACERRLQPWRTPHIEQGSAMPRTSCEARRRGARVAARWSSLAAAAAPSWRPHRRHRPCRSELYAPPVLTGGAAPSCPVLSVRRKSPEAAPPPAMTAAGLLRRPWWRPRRLRRAAGAHGRSPEGGLGAPTTHPATATSRGSYTLWIQRWR